MAEMIIDFKHQTKAVSLAGKLTLILLDVQTTQSEMVERGLSARTVRYTHRCIKVRNPAGTSVASVARSCRGQYQSSASRGEMRSLPWSKRRQLLRLLWPHIPYLR
jgi:hypothetical protein